MKTKAAVRRFAVSALPLASLLWAVTPAAASMATDVFLTNVRLNVDVLAASSRAAADKAGDDALKSFARDEIRHQGAVLAHLDAWWTHENDAAPAEVASLPVETGRSVAIDPPAGAEGFAPPPGIGVAMMSASSTLDRLSGLDGAAFDASYRTTQIDTLKTLEGLYDSYAHTGDIAVLRDLAGKELPEVRAELAALGQV